MRRKTWLAIATSGLAVILLAGVGVSLHSAWRAADARRKATSVLEKAQQQGGWSWELVLDAVQELSSYGSDTLQRLQKELERDHLLARRLNLAFVTRCYRLEHEALARLEKKLCTDDPYQLYEAMTAMRLAAKAGMKPEQFSRFWSRLARAGKQNLSSSAADSRALWFEPFAGSIPPGSDPYVDACVLVLRMHLGKLALEQLLGRAEESSDPVFRGEIGYRTALEGNREGLRLLAKAASRDSARRHHLLLKLHVLFEPPHFVLKRVPSAEEWDALEETDWLAWLLEREDRLVFEKGRFRFQDAKRDSLGR